MIKYSHFAVPNLYLQDGYVQEETEYGKTTSYVDLDGLEDCVRKILVRTPMDLTGTQLRFLRRGLSLTQEEFGSMIGKDSQTVARMEKSEDVIPKPVDLLLRARYLAKLDPSFHLGELLCIHDRTTRVPQERIVLSYSNGRWTFRYDIPRLQVRVTTSDVHAADMFQEFLDGDVVKRLMTITSEEDFGPPKAGVPTHGGFTPLSSLRLENEAN